MENYGLPHARSSIRLWLAAGFAFGTAVITWGAALIETNWTKIFSTVLVGVGGSMVASASVGLVLSYFREFGWRRRRTILCDLLGVKSLDEDIAIVLATFPANSHGIDSGVLSGSSSVQRSSAIKDYRLTNRFSLASDDIAAMRHISAIFDELGVKSPAIEFDDGAWDGVFGPRRGKVYSAYIAIGLFSNHLTVELAERRVESDRRLFALSNAEAFHAGLRAAAVCPQHSLPKDWVKTDPERWTLQIKARLDDDPEQLHSTPDFALIAKCQTPLGSPCIIVGGGKSGGTSTAASSLRANWKALYAHVDSTGKTKVGSNCFAAIYDLDGKPHAQLSERGLRIFSAAD